jgi:hypothetical protein
VIEPASMPSLQCPLGECKRRASVVFRGWACADATYNATPGDSNLTA